LIYKHKVLSNIKFKIDIKLVCHIKEEHGRGIIENVVLRKVFRPKRKTGTGGWRKQLNEDLYNLYASPNVSRVIIARRMRLAGYVASMGEKKC
jgi:hypothetical protein